MKATLNFTTYADAKAFAVAWSRHTLRGHSISPINPAGGAIVTLDNVTDTEKAWIDNYAATLKR